MIVLVTETIIATKETTGGTEIVGIEEIVAQDPDREIVIEDAAVLKVPFAINNHQRISKPMHLRYHKKYLNILTLKALKN